MTALLEGKHCYLGDGLWLSVLRSSMLSDSTIPESSEMVTDYTEITINLTNLVKDCTDLFLRRKKGRDGDAQDRHLDLLAECNSQQDTVIRYTQKWAKEFIKQSKGRKANKPSSGDMESALSWKITMMVLSRLHVALCGDGTLAMERQAQNLAQELVDELNAPQSRIAGPSVIQCRATTSAVLTTAPDWLAFCNDRQDKYASVGERRLITPEVYLHWLRLNGIQVPESSDDQA